MSKQKNILVCVSGLTPQIITETLFALSVIQNIIVDEIFIITTARGKRVIQGKDSAANTPKSPLVKEIKNLCLRYELQLPKISEKNIIVAKEESLELSDIRSDRDNILFPNKVSEFIKEISSDLDSTLYCSISGGRKTMSVHLSLALSLFGREQDRLLHVLTSEKFEFAKFYPETKSEQSAIQLSEIPFVRLRHFITPNLEKKKLFAMQYTDIVEFTQKQLNILSSSQKLILNIEQKEIRYDDYSIKLEPILFAVYFKFIERRLENKSRISIHEITTKDFSDSLVEFITESFPYYYFSEDRKYSWWKNCFTSEDFRVKRSKINKKIAELSEDKNLLKLIQISSVREYGDTKYLVQIPAEKIKVTYP